MVPTVFLLLLWIACGTMGQRCPPVEDLAPHCACRPYNTFSMMFCSHITCAEELIPPVKSTEGYDIVGLDIVDSSLLYIPSGLFKNTRFAGISFGNTEVMSLSDTDLAFEGLENHLEELRATGSHYVTTWDWSQLRNHTKLRLIDINNIGLYNLDVDFPRLESMNALGITNAKLSFIHPTAFKELPNLTLLILKSNEISEMSRSMIPVPAEKLYHLDLSDNQLATLPSDMFTRMPNLKEVFLRNNKFETFNEVTFSSVFNSLLMLMLGGNDIRCDCRLEWLINHKIPLYFEGNCHSPKEILGKSLKHIKPVDLWC